MTRLAAAIAACLGSFLLASSLSKPPAVLPLSNLLFTNQPYTNQPPASAPLPGRTTFHEKGCEFCHGPDLHGTDKGPDLTGVGRRLRPEQIQHQIHNGGGNMPAFADTLTEQEEADLVKFLATLKSKAPHPQPAPPPSQPGTSLLLF